MPRPRKPAGPFRYFNSSPAVIRLVVMMYVRFPLSLRNVEDLLFERGIDICHEIVRLLSTVPCNTLAQPPAACLNSYRRRTPINGSRTARTTSLACIGKRSEYRPVASTRTIISFSGKSRVRPCSSASCLESSADGDPISR